MNELQPQETVCMNLVTIIKWKKLDIKDCMEYDYASI